MTLYLIPYRAVPKEVKPPIVRGGKRPTRKESEES